MVEKRAGSGTGADHSLVTFQVREEAPSAHVNGVVELLLPPHACGRLYSRLVRLTTERNHRPSPPEDERGEDLEPHLRMQEFQAVQDLDL